MALRNMMKFLKDKKEAPLPQKAQEESGFFDRRRFPDIPCG